MKELRLVIQNGVGLHARPAKTLVNLAKQFQSKISIEYGGKTVNAKSMIGILRLGVKRMGEITVVVEGDDEDKAADALTLAIRSGLGESLGEHVVANGQGEAVAGVVVVDGVAPAGNDALLIGTPASDGIAIGSVFQLRRKEISITRPFQGVSEEMAALQEAIEQVEAEIARTKARALTSLSEEEAAIFDAHLSILLDPELRKGTVERIEAEQTAAQAWQMEIEAQAVMLEQLSDALLAERAIDVRDVGRQVGRVLGGETGGVVFPDDPFILLAHDLAPSETIALDPGRVLGFGTVAGGPTAHTAILARALQLPAVVGVGERLLTLADQTYVILNGKTGQIIIDPSPEEVAQAEKENEALQQKRTLARASMKNEARTVDGKRIEVVANVSSPTESAQAYELGAEGIGLLRTEFLFLEQDVSPSEEKQLAIYGEVVRAMQNQPVIIRTLDIGGDKPVPYIDVGEEENPFLGERGIRLCLNRPELFRTQLRAIARASQEGQVLVMFPMISDVGELRQARQMVADVVKEVGVEPFPIGMMIEVPSAALMADKFTPYLDFFSIGTNDLTQYTLAVDRQHPALARLADGLHPAVLRLIDATVKAAHKAGKWVGVCGELAADPQAVPLLLGLGVDELSVNMNAVPTVKAQVRTLSLPDAKQLALRALDCATASEVRQLENLV